ncbi:PQ loop repeat-domain-containing protein [Cryomyces antarcticus]
MPAWLSITTLVPILPDHCEPANAYLFWLSSTLHTCVPTNLALISTLLGTLSIVSWLFAQLPQIYKNYTLKSTSGLSIFFLTEWCLGDLSNLLGALFTGQATWQVVVAGYYCFVDSMLVAQWTWYERLRHGRPLVSVWRRKNLSRDDDIDDGGMQEVIEGVPILSQTSSTLSQTSDKNSSGKQTPAKEIYSSKQRPKPVFRTPTFDRLPRDQDACYDKGEPASSSLGATPTSRTIYRIQHGSSPMPSPKTILFLTLLIALTQASPLSPPSSLTPPAASLSHSPTNPREAAGRLLSWLSTLLYLGSRLPQLYRNHSRRSTAGLSPALFAAAFFGNLFYASSLLANPCAWSDLPPHGAGGWVGAAGSRRAEWVGRALPFWLGAAGVLGLDAGVGVQFWWFGDGAGDGGPERIVVAKSPEGTRWRWRRVNGWMRGWVPSVGEAAAGEEETRKTGGGGQRDGLLRRQGEGGGYGTVV